MKKGFVKKIVVLTLLLGFFIQCTTFDSNATYIPPGFSAFYINVGAGDCILLQKGEEFALIDTGAGVYDTDNNSWDEVNDFLQKKGVETLKYLFITHLDYDHCGNVSNLNNNYTIENIVYRELDSDAQAKLPSGHQSRYKLIAGLDSNHITTCYDGAPDLEIFDGVTLKFYNREKLYLTDESKEWANLTTTNRINADSLIFKITYEENSFFFTGDCGCTYLTKTFSSDELKSDVYKISHHGISANNTKDLINAVYPDIAICSSAFDITKYSKCTETFNRLTAVGAKVYSTLNIEDQISSPQDATYVAILVRSYNGYLGTYGVYNYGSTKLSLSKLDSPLE